MRDENTNENTKREECLVIGLSFEEATMVLSKMTDIEAFEFRGIDLYVATYDGREKVQLIMPAAGENILIVPLVSRH